MCNFTTYNLRHMKKGITTFIFIFFAISAYSQTEQPVIVELSGAVITNDSLKQFIPYAHILVQNRNQIMATNDEGFFAFAAVANDTIIFSHLGFKTEKLWIPDTLKDKAYLVMVTLEWDTTMLEPVILYPWPSKDNFSEDFLAMQVKMTEYDMAQRNLAIAALKEKAAAMGYSAEEMSNYIMKVQNQSMYNQGRYYGADGGAAIVGALTNPFAWAEFFNALKRGDFKSKK